jgi:stage II sporulation protein D
MVMVGCAEREYAGPTPQMDIEPQFWVRVLLLDDTTDCALKTDTAFTVLDPKTQTTRAFFGRAAEPLKLSISAGGISIGRRCFTENEIIIFPDSPHIFNLNGSDYRGKLKLTINSDGNSFDAINMVPIEPYLAGVVGAEMPDYWEPAALKAQAIAARTYCLYIKKRFGTGRSWDVGKTQAHQVYRGLAAESAPVWDAVNRTKGQVLVCKQDNGTEDIFPAYYSSACGGHTENSKNLWGESFEPLAGVPCPYCRYVAKAKYFFWPMVQFDKADVTKRISEKYPKLKELGEIKNIIPAKQSDYGEFSRLTLVKLVGSTSKSDFLRAEDLRLALDPAGETLKSMICQIAEMGDRWAFLYGRGYGHGAGMCQCGAEGMAREGKTASQILSYYYPGSEIVTIY